MLFTQTGVFATDGVLKRSDVEAQYKWKLEDIYSNTEAVNTDIVKIQKEYIPKIQTFKGKLNSASSLFQCLKLRDEMLRIIEKIYVYAHMKADENQADNGAVELSSRTETLYSEVAAEIAFINPELLEKSQATIEAFAKDSILKDYAAYLLSLTQQKAHMLSKGEEELLAAAADIGSSPNDIYNKLRLADMKYPKIQDEDGNEIQLSPGVYSSALDSKDRDFRKRAFEGIFGAFDKNKNTFAATLNAEVKKNIFFAKARKYDSAMEASLAAEYIPVDVYNNLVKAVNNNLGALHKYVDLRKRVLGLDKVHLYDMYVSVVDNYDMTIPYEDAKNMILEGLKPLGSEYVNNLKKGFEGGWVDVYETENKATGGYQWGSYDTHPYVLMNYNDSVDSMLTLAHEMGHALNSYYTNASQNYIDSNVPIFNAEVASTTNELLMLRYMINNAKDDDEKLYLINNLVEQIRGSVYTQVMYSEFEKVIHERVEQGNALSAESLKNIWKSLMQKYYGDNFEVDELATMWWSRIPHFYMNFYVYKYATSMAASNQLVKNMTESKNKFIAKYKYLEFLKAGSSNYPIELLKKAGVDMKSTAPVDNLLAEFSKLVDQMEEILKKQGKVK
ncbi:MAG: oligoendopeptidase F [Clostridia bacterium]|nr:oligoendopeptidase F [Clostridia bacterium]